RLRPATEKVPKALLEVAGRPFIDHQLRLLARNGVRRALICAGYLGEQIKDFVGGGERYGLSVEFIFDGKELLGTGGAVKNAAGRAGELFFVMYGDSYLTEPFAPIENYFLAGGKPALMTVYENRGKFDASNIVFKDGKIIRYDKKNRTPDMLWIDYGLCLFRRSAFETEKYGAKFDLAQLLGDLVPRKEVLGWQVKDRFYEIGSFAGLQETDKFLAENRPE
ncbi:MAG: nucleotidyl transferase, partial [Elusimicrobia bacterium RIFOXYB2_FULL_62_6]